MNSEWHEAAISGNVPALTRLVADEVDINGRDQHGQTALMLAAMHGRRDAVGFLLSHNADLDVTAKYSLSALMLAIINRHATIAEMLVESGADTSIKGTGAPGFAAKTSYDLALQHVGIDLAELIARGTS